MLPSRRAFLKASALASLASLARGQTADAPRNVILMTTDGLRWQEVFRGAEESLMSSRPGGVANVAALRKEFWRDTPEERRAALLPFVWEVIARQGQLYGNQDAGSVVRVTNGKNFSYPGYSEILSGWGDPRINSNNKVPNPNVTVLEWLNRRPAFHGRVAAFGAWDVFPYIINAERSGVPVVSGWEPIKRNDLSEREQLLNDLLRTTHPIWDGECYDSFTFEAALEHLRRRRPRVLSIGFGETDEFAHEGRYDHYLHSAHRFDASLRRLWDTVQSMPDYRDQTALLIATDHGRGDAPDGWKSHGAGLKGSEAVWIGALGPGVPALGMRTNVEPLTQSQIAATVAALVGADFPAENPKAAPAIAGLGTSNHP